MNENKKLVEGWNIIGEAPVDSGQLMICDPGYLKQFKKEEVKKLGVIFNSGFGDGIYPIEALVKNYGTKKNPNLRIAEIRIVMIDE